MAEGLVILPFYWRVIVIFFSVQIQISLYYSYFTTMIMGSKKDISSEW